MQRKSNFCVFDFDGTIAINGKITSKNKKILSKINNKALNTSRSINELPKDIFDYFDYIMTLDGSKYHVKGKLVKEFKTLSKKRISKIINFAKKNKLNITFNNTKGPFYNVKSKKSKEFMEKNNITFYSDIKIPERVFLIALSHHTFTPGYKGSKRQSDRFIEISKNDKSNISKFFKGYTAYGDNNNDIPMMKKAKKAIWVKGANINE